MSSNTPRRSHEPEELVTVVADPRVLYGIKEEELTPVVEAATETGKKRDATPMRAVLIAVALLAVGLLAYRGVARFQFSRAQAAAQAGASRRAQAEKAASAPAAARPAAKAEPEVLTPATPEQAARSFARGEYEEALAQYRYLAREKPEAKVYQVMVKVLSARGREH